MEVCCSVIVSEETEAGVRVEPLLILACKLFVLFACKHFFANLLIYKSEILPLFSAYLLIHYSW